MKIAEIMWKVFQSEPYQNYLFLGFAVKGW